MIAYDSKGPTFRHERYPEYKANRAKMPEELVEQIPLVKRMIDAMTLPSMEVSGWEADDIVGTISEKIKDKNIHLYIDKTDYAVLKVRMIEPGDDYTNIEFSNRKTNQPIGDEKFIVK